MFAIKVCTKRWREPYNYLQNLLKLYTTSEGWENEAKAHYGLQMSEQPDGHATKHNFPVSCPSWTEICNNIWSNLTRNSLF